MEMDEMICGKRRNREWSTNAVSVGMCMMRTKRVSHFRRGGGALHHAAAAEIAVNPEMKGADYESEMPSGKAACLGK